jgi:hypothetical protein
MYKIYVVFMLLSTLTIVTRENDNSLYQSISVFVSEDTMFFFLHRRDQDLSRMNKHEHYSKIRVEEISF